MKYFIFFLIFVTFWGCKKNVPDDNNYDNSVNSIVVKSIDNKGFFILDNSTNYKYFLFYFNCETNKITPIEGSMGLPNVSKFISLGFVKGYQIDVDNLLFIRDNFEVWQFNLVNKKWSKVSNNTIGDLSNMYHAFYMGGNSVITYDSTGMKILISGSVFSNERYARPYYGNYFIYDIGYRKWTKMNLSIPNLHSVLNQSVENDTVEYIVDVEGYYNYGSYEAYVQKWKFNYKTEQLIKDSITTVDSLLYMPLEEKVIKQQPWNTSDIISDNYNTFLVNYNTSIYYKFIQYTNAGVSVLTLNTQNVNASWDTLAIDKTLRLTIYDYNSNKYPSSVFFIDEYVPMDYFFSMPQYNSIYFFSVYSKIWQFKTDTKTWVDLGEFSAADYNRKEK